MFDEIFFIVRHNNALEGITICGEIRSQDRFTPIIQGLASDDTQMKVSGHSYGKHGFTILHLQNNLFLTLERICCIVLVSIKSWEIKSTPYKQ